jgi:hypothetical protein
MKFLLPFALTLALTSPTIAQDQEVTTAANDYVNAPATQKMFDQMFSVEGVMGQMGIDVSKLTDAQMEKIEAIIAEEMQENRPSMERALATGMSEVLSLGEIVALTDFQSTDYGASTFAKMDPYFKSTMRDFAPSTEAMRTRLLSRIRDVLGG